MEGINALRHRILLLSQFLLICAVVYLKLRADSAYFLTPDSHYYLQAAQNLLAGNGYRIVFEGKETFCAIWPVGYSALIAGMSALSTFSVETASKIVNLMALAGCFWLIYRRFQDKAWFVALGLMTSSLVQLYTNTWSETVFLFFVLGFCIHPSSYKEKGTGVEVVGFLWALGAFLTRYAGVFLLIPLLIRRRFRTAIYYSLFISGYLLYNFYQTHTFTGGHGFWPNEPFEERLLRGMRGLGEEALFFAVRDWELKRLTLSASAQWFIYGVALLQFLILTTICRLVGPSVKSGFKNGLKILFRSGFGLQIRNSMGQIRNSMENVFFLVAISYLFFTIVIYFADASIESLYFRRLGPASLLFTVGGLAWVSEQKHIFEKTKWLFVAFFALSIIHSLPK
ncbi:hypothetical protein [Runella slithyformis]|uniref:Glycosyltransferase RgtA/B/C/D-like domain-containing protein n=1 Tax=Runella slithyformis (strain ATCC 29530 / DSM 19594 / LMG 11500 / NCIMB 11436 / LSU 4) TaxID=761193 RepID=A0A7U3ZMD3_RUNSL|nr:hypothetical protein [Runella slithyformis]AEI49872.1 hypothetical protein Runsl_3510 [Runella slithyformis DSM 19594]